MSLLEKLKAEGQRVKEATEARRGSSFDDVVTFKPGEGDNMIRILPHWDPAKRGSDELFFARRLIHYLPQKKKDGSGTYNAPITCRAMFDEVCSACKAHDKLKKLKDKKAQDIRVTERFLYNIIDYGERGKREPQVCVYPAPQTVHAEIMEWAGELATEFWDLEAGRDWKLKKTTDKAKGAFGTKYKMMPKMSDSAVPKKLLEGLDDAMTDLDTMMMENAIERMVAGLELLGLEVEMPAAKPGKAAKPAAAKVKPAPKAEDDDVRPDDDGFPDDDEEEAEEPEEEAPPPAAKRAAAKPAKAAKAEEPEEEADEDLDAELKRLGV